MTTLVAPTENEARTLIDALDDCGGIQWPWTAHDVRQPSSIIKGPSRERRLFADKGVARIFLMRNSSTGGCRTGILRGWTWRSRATRRRKSTCRIGCWRMPRNLAGAQFLWPFEPGAGRTSTDWAQRNPEHRRVRSKHQKSSNAQAQRRRRRWRNLDWHIWVFFGA
jgi:hypothetical protein